jgi:hypothetical protein
MARAISSTSSRARIQAALAFLTHHAADAELTIVAASRGAADELARALVAARGATFGVSRYGFNELVARLAAPVLARARVAPASPLSLEAVAARASFEQADDLRYFEPVARMPGFPRSVARTLGELALAGVETARLAALGDSGADLADLERGLRAETERSGLVGRADVLRAASAAVATSSLVAAGRPIVLLDVPIDGPLETSLVGALLARAGSALFTVTADDRATTDALKTLGVPVDAVRDGGPVGALGRLGTYLFSTEAPPEVGEDESVQLFSAPGEGRECLEIVRRILQRAADGVRFDEMAVLVRSPQQYIGLLEHACARAGVPAWFDRGTRRPDPAAGRCWRCWLARTRTSPLGGSPSILSLGQVPTSGETEAASAIWVAPEREGEEGEEGEPGEEGRAGRREDPAAPIAGGSLRTPWRWERLLVDAKLIHYRDRWHRRLDGLDAEYARKLEALIAEEPESPRIPAIERERDNLHALQDFALPLVDTLASWPESDRWAGWLSRLHALVPKVLRRPTRVLRVLAELAPLGDVGTGHAARGQRRAGSTVEPARRRATEPALRARLRRQPAPGARPIVSRGVRPRPRGAAVSAAPARGSAAARRSPHRGGRRPCLCRPRAAPASACCCSWLPALRPSGSTSRFPASSWASRGRASRPSTRSTSSAPSRAGCRGTTRWPARPRRLRGATRVARAAGPNRGVRRSRARPLGACTALQEKDGAATGHAHYLLKLNAHLKRAVIERWSRSMKQWSPADGVMRTTDATRPLLEQHRLTARPYSLSALQRYAACPYQFLLSAIYRLAPGGGARAAPAHGSADTRQPVSLHSDGVLPDAGARRPASDPVGGIGQRDVVRDGTRRGRRRTATNWRQPSRACGTTKCACSSETCCAGSITSARIPTAGSRGGSSSPSVFRTIASATRGA